MPGTREREERTVMIQVRVTEAEAKAWREHVEKARGYLSVMVRELVNQHVSEGVKHCPRGHWG